MMGNCERDLDEETIYGVSRLGCENEARHVTFCNRRCRYPITNPLELAGRGRQIVSDLERHGFASSIKSIRTVQPLGLE